MDRAKFSVIKIAIVALLYWPFVLAIAFMQLSLISPNPGAVTFDTVLGRVVGVLLLGGILFAGLLWLMRAYLKRD